MQINRLQFSQPAIVVYSDLTLINEVKVDFDADLPHYGTEKGVLTNQDEGEIFAPVAMWLEAVDLVLSRLRKDGLDFSSVAAISGAGMQHGIVCWRRDKAAAALAELNPGKGLMEQLHGPSQPVAFTNRFSPNWQDASTQSQCDMFDACLGSPDALAEVTGSKAHHVGRLSFSFLLKLCRLSVIGAGWLTDHISDLVVLR